MKVSLRKVVSEDKNLFAKWWRDPELISLTSGDFNLLSDDEMTKSLTEMSAGDWHWIIEADNQPIGHINLEKIDETTAEMQIVIGEKEYWGKDVAQEAAEQLFEKAIKHGFNKIVVEVRPSNLRAMGFYQKMGFLNKDIKKYPENPNLPEVIIMEKAL